jgi:tripartite-type tricarboxylate transporter receptor subunit TctC
VAKLILTTTITSSRRTRGLAFAALLAMGPACVPAAAQSADDYFRGRTITISVGLSAGGGYDLHARVFARYFGRHVLGEPAIVVKNTPGAAGLALVNSFYNSAPKDGTELATFDRGIPLEPLLHGLANARFDPLKLIWIGSTDNDPSTCFSWFSSPIKTIWDAMQRELIVGGTGSTANAVAYPRALNAVLGTKFRVIAGYPGSAEALIAIERGETQGFCSMGFATLESVRPDWVREHKVNQLVQLAVRKNPDHPEVPLALDLASSEADRAALTLMFSPNLYARPFAAPPGLAPERVAILRKAFNETVRDPDYIAEARTRGLHVELVTGDEIGRIIRQLYASPTDVVERMRGAMK